jgi:hypothetical protein
MSWIREKSLDRKRGEMERQSEGWLTEKSLLLLGTELYAEHGHSLVMIFSGSVTGMMTVTEPSSSEDQNMEPAGCDLDM